MQFPHMMKTRPHVLALFALAMLPLVGVSSCDDQDGDGYTSSIDCNDQDPNIHPGAVETCDGFDQNCDGMIDEGLETSVWYRDADGDGYGSTGEVSQDCSQPTGYVSQPGDCDDSNTSVNPGASDICNGIDDDCSGLVDECSIRYFWKDSDGDGYGSCSYVGACTAPEGYVTNHSDCDDSNASITTGCQHACSRLPDSAC